MKTLEQRARAEKRLDSAMKGAAAYATIALTAEMNGSRLLAAIGMAGLLVDTAFVAYYGIRYNEYFRQISDERPDLAKNHQF